MFTPPSPVFHQHNFSTLGCYIKYLYHPCNIDTHTQTHTHTHTHTAATSILTRLIILFTLSLFLNRREESEVSSENSCWYPSISENIWLRQYPAMHPLLIYLSFLAVSWNRSTYNTSRVPALIVLLRPQQGYPRLAHTPRHTVRQSRTTHKRRPPVPSQAVQLHCWQPCCWQFTWPRPHTGTPIQKLSLSEFCLASPHSAIEVLALDAFENAALPDWQKTKAVCC